MYIMKGTVAIVLAIVLAIGLAIASWQLHWFVKGQNVSKQAQILRHSYGAQQALRSSATNGIATYYQIGVQITKSTGATKQALINQQQAVQAQVCGEIAQMHGGTGAVIGTFGQKECNQ